VGVKEGLLALLRGQPKHGYQLKGEFEQATGQLWPLNIGQVYSSLQRLERDDLVAIAAEGDDRRSYRITAEGLSFLRGWLLRPVPRDGESRDEVTMKVLMAVASGAAAVDEVVARQREETMAALQRFTRHKALTSPSDFAALVQLDRLILRFRAELDWLDLVEARSDTGDVTSSAKADVTSSAKAPS
jgi:DNA-binding PadR family transcriptional regulator